MSLQDNLNRKIRQIDNNPPKFPSLHSGGFLAGTELKGYSNPRSRNGGFPSNPVPMINRLMPDKKGGPLVGLKRFIGTEVAIPVAIPQHFRVSPELMRVGKTTKGMGGAIKGFQDAVNLHPAILPSNPMAFNIVNQVRESINPVVNNKPALRNALSRVTGLVGSARNSVSSTAQNRSPF